MTRSPDTIRHSRKGLFHAVMDVAALWADLRSKGATKVGAAVYHIDSGTMLLGYNGFPSGVVDREEWWDRKAADPLINKHDLVVHAEANAIRRAHSLLGLDLSGCALFCTHRPCSRCVRDSIAPSGIEQVWYASEAADMLTERDKIVSDTIAREMGLKLETMHLT